MYTEVGDAGDTPATAQAITGVAGVTYTSIVGTTNATNGLFDSDMYQITIATATPFTFTASTTGFAVGANNFDTQITLFNSSGVGVLTNDDAAGGGEQSSLSTTSATLTPGNYYLLVSGSGRYPVDTAGNLIFPNYTDGATDASGTYAATSALPIAGYTGNTNEGGKYVVALSFGLPTVPEPGTYVYLLAGLAGLICLARVRRSSSR